MSTKIILVGHGKLGKALLESLTMIMGTQDPDEIVAVDFYEDDSRELLQERLEEQVLRLNCEENHLVICCDMQGGTPFNASYLISKKHPLSIICGMNLPMLLEFIALKDSYEDKESLIPMIEMTRETLKVI